MSDAWYCKTFGQELGPMPLTDLMLLVNRGDIVPSDPIKRGAEGDWRPAGDEPLLFSEAALSVDDADADFATTAASAPPSPEPAEEPPAQTKAASGAQPSQPSPDPSPENDSAPPDAVPTAPSAEVSADQGPQTTAPSVRKIPSRKVVMVGAVALMLGGGSCGAVTRMILGSGTATPPAANSAAVAEQRQLAELTQQVADLQRRRDELKSSRPAEEQPPLRSDSDSTPEPIPARDAPDTNAAPAGAPPADPESVKPAKSEKGAPSEPPSSPPAEAQPAEAAAPALASNSPAMPRANFKGPGISGNAAPASGAGGSSAPSAQQTRERQQQRLALLRQIYVRRQELLADFAELDRERENLANAIAATETSYATVNAAAVTAAASIALEQVSVTRNPATISRLQAKYVELGGKAATLKLQREQQAVQEEELMARIKVKSEEADALRSSWLAVVDPFGQLDDGDQEMALAAFTEWTALEPESPGPWLARGFAYWQLNRLDEALSDFNMAVKLAGPMLSNSLAARGGLLHAMQKPKEAMVDFGKALKFNKTDGMVYLFRGRTFCADQKFQAAVKDFKMAIQLNAKDSEAFRNLALLQATCPQSRFRNGKLAVENARQACELTEWKNWTAVDTLAAACAEAHNFTDAQQWAEKAAEMTHGANQGRCLARLKQYQAEEPLRLDWKSQYGNPAAVNDSPIVK